MMPLLKCCSFLKENHGFTLVEVVMAAAIIGIGFLGIVRLSMGIMTASQTAGDMAAASALVQQKMASIRQASYFGIGTSGTVLTEDYDTITDFPRFKRTVEIFSIGNTHGLKGVDVTVRWHQQRLRKVNCITIISR